MGDENIQVVVRIRPINKTEKARGEKQCVLPLSDGKEVQVVKGPNDAQVYRCTNCFPNDTDQEVFFQQSGVTNMLESAIEGFRSCAFAFGQVIKILSDHDHRLIITTDWSGENVYVRWSNQHNNARARR